MGKFEEYTFYVDHTQRLSERRQAATQTFLTINTALFTILAFLFKDAGIPTNQRALVILPLFVAGLLVCWLWGKILLQYKALLGWRYTQLRAMEQDQPDSYRLLTREWDEYYKPLERKTGTTFSDLELWLPMTFGALYGVGLAIVVVIVVAGLA